MGFRRNQKSGTPLKQMLSKIMQSKLTEPNQAGVCCRKKLPMDSE